VRDFLDLVIVPDHVAVAGDHEGEADESQRPRRERPQDDNEGDFRELAKRPRISKHVHEPRDNRVLLVTAARQHVIRAQHIGCFQHDRGDREKRDSNVAHYPRTDASGPIEHLVAALFLPDSVREG